MYEKCLHNLKNVVIMEELAVWCLVWMIILVIIGGIAFVFLYDRILTIREEVEKLKKLREE